MNDHPNRRQFLGQTALGLGALALSGTFETATVTAQRPRSISKSAPPLSIASANGVAAVGKAVSEMQRGADTLDAVIAGVNIVELDPQDNSVGYGGLPNERGEVELDASVMHGPTRRAGAVASLRGVREPSKVARVVLERTDHILLVGQGARDFATAHGFENVELLTSESRLAWLNWKETLSNKDKWGPSPYVPTPASPAGVRKLAASREHAASYALAQQIAGNDTQKLENLLAWADAVAQKPPTGTINCLALDTSFDISGVTTTSGLAWKIPGRVGDSPLIGCGLYVDNDIGAAGSTGRGEENIYINGARTVVEYLRQGKSPEQACLDALKLIAARYGNDLTKLAEIDVNFYALNKKGEYAGAAIWSHTIIGAGQYARRKFAVADGTGARLQESAYLFERKEVR